MQQTQDTLMTQVLQVVEKEGPECLRSLLQTVCQAVVEAEMTQFLQAQPYERTPQLPQRLQDAHAYHSLGPTGAARAARSRRAFLHAVVRALPTQ